MGCCFSKTPSQRSSRSSEKVQSHYAPTAPSWDIIDSSSVYTSERRDEERSSESKRQISDQKIAVYKKRNDCLFYYHHKCSKGDNCEYRHERAALGSRRTCSLWKDQKCLREHCPLRHMKLKNNKKPCFLEEGGVSCYVEGCPFKHLKSEDKQGDNDASKANCSKVETENKRDNNAGDHNKSGEPKHHDEKINRSGCHPQFDNEKQSTNSAAAVHDSDSCAHCWSCWWCADFWCG
ncbi:uncharacterized protein [Anabrus simplex]|uniref:uncharacterized protein n=1 Tax=Anabrus simplex TaxID=316456 RepID=UPI0035A3D0C4